MPTLRKVPQPADESSPAPMSFKQAADLLRSHGYSVTGDGGSMFLVAREQPVEQALLDKAGVVAKAQALHEAQIAGDVAAPPSAIPDDLVGWIWELGEQGLRLINPPEGYTTAWHPADREAARIFAEARQIWQRDAELIAADPPTDDERPRLIAVLAAQDAGLPIPTGAAMTAYVALDRIKPNPWQPRLTTDAAYIADLAADILARH